MDNVTIQVLIDLNGRFYRDHAASFSVTRQGAWPGWERVASHLEPGRLLDVACGNLRFERFLDERFGPGAFEFTCLDSCAALAEDTSGIDFMECDVIGSLAAGKGISAGKAASFDAAVSFGFMHHVPTQALRKDFMRALVECVRPGGVAALSFWRFADDEGLFAKAQKTTAAGSAALGIDAARDFDEGDFLLGWNCEPGAFRYCHSFTDREIDWLVRRVDDTAEPIERFSADGRTGRLNEYLVFRRAYH